MKKLSLNFLLLIQTIFVFSNQNHLNFKQIVNRYVDLIRLTEQPEIGEKSYMISSYDRRSQYDSKEDKYVNWQANKDGDGFVRKDGDDYILAHIKGTGYINRIWSAKPEKGNITFIIDGKNVLSMPAAHIFDAKHAPFNFPEFVYTSAKGKNNYIPICFQKECIVKASKNWGKFYQINYSLLPHNYSVSPFKGEFSKSEQLILKTIGSQFKNSYKELDRKLKKTILTPNERVEIYDLKGSKIISQLEFNVKDNDFLDDLMRNVEIELYWDNCDVPAIKSSLGAFFGASVHDCKNLSQYNSVPLGIVGSKLYSNWQMPFNKRAKIVLINKSHRNIKISSRLKTIENLRNDRLYFHVKHIKGLKKIENQRWPDRLLLDQEGTGRFCGMMLTVFNPIGGIEYGYGLPKHFAQWWWGEGDDKFYVDGENFPSTFGTGTEDYFGYAWGWPVKFSNAFHSQTYTTAEGLDENNAPHFVKNGNRLVSMNRFQIMDNVPFQKSFFATLEQYYPDQRPITYQTTLYYYLDKP
jgi:hypothetical protein